MKEAMKKILLSITLGLVCSLNLWALTVGEKVTDIQLRDASDNPSKIPDFGKKVLVIFYTDPDVADQNDLLADRLKKEKFPDVNYRGMGIVNMKDTWKPNFAIRMVVRKKIEKYDSTILTDPGYLLKNSWKLGDCDEKSVVMLVDKQSTIRYLKPGALNGKEVDLLVDQIKQLIKL